MGIRYTVHYRKGKEYTVADALSRRGILEKGCNVVSAVVPEWFKECSKVMMGTNN